MIAVVLLSVTIVLMCIILTKERGRKREGVCPAPPGPRPLPILGSLHLLARHKIPFQAFTELKQEFGSVVRLRLGTTDCVVLQSEESIRQALITKADHFDSRPNFFRFHIMFGGSKKNALAFCDYDELQRVKKRILGAHTFPGYLSRGWTRLDQAFSLEVNHLMDVIEKADDLKLVLSKACSNIFKSYFCDVSRSPYSDPEHNRYIRNFDLIFWEVNNGRLVDFIPELMPLMAGTMREVTSWCKDIRSYVNTHILETRSGTERNLLEELMDRVNQDSDKQENETKLSQDGALYALEDILGGHCAVANITLRMLRYISQNPEVQARLQREIQAELPASELRLEKVSKCQYLTACFYETLRLTSSAIVPHMTNRDTSVDGFHIPNQTVVFINNHCSNFSGEYWTSPEQFMPQRFLKEGRFVKPSHFLPFSTGRRSCIGYKIVQLLATSLVAVIQRTYRVDCLSEEDVPLGMLALPPKPFRFKLHPVQLGEPSKIH